MVRELKHHEKKYVRTYNPTRRNLNPIPSNIFKASRYHNDQLLTIKPLQASTEGRLSQLQVGRQPPRT